MSMRYGRVERPQHFVHIPKTGGTTLISLLDRHFAADRIFPAQLFAELGPKTPHAAHELYRGHFGFNGLDTVIGRDFDHLTMLRQIGPLAWSTYRFMQRETGTRWHQQASTLSFEQFYELEEVQGALTDRQCAFLSFDLAADACADQILFAERSARVVAQMTTEDAATVTPAERLARAIVALGDCRWFGLTERYEESLQLLAFEYAWPAVRHVQPLRRRDTMELPSASAIARVEARNRNDRKLLDVAEAEFNRRLHTMRETLEQDYPEITDVNEALNQRYRDHRNLGSVHRSFAEVGFAQPLAGDNWHRREEKTPEGDWFRWTGPGTNSWLDGPLLAAGRWQLRLRLVNTVDLDWFEQLDVFVDRVRINLTTASGHGTPVRELVGEFVCAEDHSPCIQIATPATEPVTDGDDVIDARQLGVAVHWLQFRALP